jgi:hypothetical protein
MQNPSEFDGEQVAELLGAIRATLEEYSKKLAVMAAQHRGDYEETNRQHTAALKELEALRSRSAQLVDDQGALLKEIREGWGKHIAKAAAAAGSAQAEAYGDRVITAFDARLKRATDKAMALMSQVSATGDEISHVSRHLGWKVAAVTGAWTLVAVLLLATFAWVRADRVLQAKAAQYSRSAVAALVLRSELGEGKTRPCEVAGRTRVCVRVAPSIAPIKDKEDGGVYAVVAN